MSPGTCPSCSFLFSFWTHYCPPKKQIPIPGLQYSAGIILHCKICKWKFTLIVDQKHVILSFGGFCKSSKCTDTSRVINIIFLIPFFYLFFFSSARHEGFPRKQWYCNLVLYITTKCLSLRVSLHFHFLPHSSYNSWWVGRFIV